MITKNSKENVMKKLIFALSATLLVLLILLTVLLLLPRPGMVAENPPTTPITDLPTEDTTPEPSTAPPTEATEIPTEEPTEPVTEPVFAPAYVNDTDPANWEIEWEIVDGETQVASYQRSEPIFFEDGVYFALPGVAGFHGGNYRTGANYGTANIVDGTITQLSKTNVNSFIADPDWAGCGWTGQPLVAQWDSETRAIMNLYEDKKAKDDLVEAIYAKLDGYIHFIDMEDGSATRDPVYIGSVFKGSGALDPRGYPVLYLGAGLSVTGSPQCIYAVSLIDGSILYKLSGDHKDAHRYWYGFDGNPLVDAETDTLIWGGENAVLYTIKLNTQYDKAAGTLTMAPDEPVVSIYTSKYSRGNRYSGYESSLVAADHYLFLGDNSGLMQCIDVNTMELKWVQDLQDDINATPLLEWISEEECYLYAAPSVDYNDGNVSVYKLNALNGEIIWKYDAKCVDDSAFPGGVMGSPLMGQTGTNMEGMVIFCIGRTPTYRSAQIIAFDKESGEILWQQEAGNNVWSSPVALYTEDGNGYIFLADISGTCYLLDGENGEIMNTLELRRTVESSPVAFGNKVLLGTRPAMVLLEIN